MKTIKDNMKVRAKARDFKIKIVWYGKLLRWKYLEFTAKKGKNIQTRIKHSLRK